MLLATAAAEQTRSKIGSNPKDLWLHVDAKCRPAAPPADEKRQDFLSSREEIVEWLFLRLATRAHDDDDKIQTNPNQVESEAKIRDEIDLMLFSLLLLLSCCVWCFDFVRVSHLPVKILDDSDPIKVDSEK